MAISFPDLICNCALVQLLRIVLLISAQAFVQSCRSNLYQCMEQKKPIQHASAESLRKQSVPVHGAEAMRTSGWRSRPSKQSVPVHGAEACYRKSDGVIGLKQSVPVHGAEDWFVLLDVGWLVKQSVPVHGAEARGTPCSSIRCTKQSLPQKIDTTLQKEAWKTPRFFLISVDLTGQIDPSTLPC